MPVSAAGTAGTRLITGTSDTITMVTDISSVSGSIRGAFERGAVSRYLIGNAGGVHVDVDYSRRCENPVEVYRNGTHVNVVRAQAEIRSHNGSHRMGIAMQVRCRRCHSCLEARARYWREAATRELALTALRGARTWFGTLTLAPENHAVAAYHGKSKIGLEEWSKLSELDRLPLRNEWVNRQITLALKRLRKELGPNTFRYLLVCEAHKSGLPHYHMLLHECSASAPIRKSVLNDLWRLGHSQWRLATTGAGGYVAKYLSKAVQARVRASQHYGSAIHKTASATFSTASEKARCPSPLEEEKEFSDGQTCARLGLNETARVGEVTTG